MRQEPIARFVMGFAQHLAEIEKTPCFRAQRSELVHSRALLAVGFQARLQVACGPQVIAVSGINLLHHLLLALGIQPRLLLVNPKLQLAAGLKECVQGGWFVVSSVME